MSTVFDIDVKLEKRVDRLDHRFMNDDDFTQELYDAEMKALYAWYDNEIQRVYQEELNAPPVISR